MPAELDRLIEAVEVVSFDGGGDVEAYVRMSDGEILFDSMYGDFDPLPDDVGDESKYIAIPNRRELDLGVVLVFDFVRNESPEDADLVSDFFRKRGAYARFKDLLDSRQLLEKWYDYEQEAIRGAVLEWCRDNSLDVSDDA